MNSLLLVVLLINCTTVSFAIVIAAHCTNSLNLPALSTSGDARIFESSACSIIAVFSFKNLYGFDCAAPCFNASIQQREHSFQQLHCFLILQYMHLILSSF